MATVRFSNELKDTIERKASDIFSAEAEKLRENRPNWAEEIYQGMYSEHRAAMDALPDGYFSRVSEVSLAGFEGGDWDKSLNINTRDLKLDEERPTPDSLKNKKLHGLAEGSSYYGHTLDANDPRWDKIKGEYLTYCLAIREQAARKNTFVEGVKKVINTYATLSPALKAWPALWDLIPEHVKDRHREVTERTRVKANEIEGVDLNSLTGAVTANKLTR